MNTLPANARPCHRDERHGLYVGRSCPLCPRPQVAQEVIGCGSQFGITTDPALATVGRPSVAKAKRTMEAPKLNGTEQRWQAANPAHIPFPLRLRWGKCMNYTPDFMGAAGLVGAQRPVLIEVKGGFIRDRDLVRFKGCAAEWGWLFEFQLWQWKDRKWTQLL